MSTEGLYRLLAWASPAFPTGGFSYSHGLEAAAESGAVHDRATLEGWIRAAIAHGSGRLDADILRDAWRAASAGDDTALAEANRRGVAYRATAELALESSQPGAAFTAAYRAAWCCEDKEEPSPPIGGRGQGEGGFSSAGHQHPPHLNPLPPLTGGEVREKADPLAESICHAAVFGTAEARAGIGLADALTAYLHAFAANLMSAGLRLGIVGQNDGQRILAALEPVVTAAVDASLARDQEDFGAATFALDLASMAHETQYTRLFRS
jgi:urease accessory protein